MRPQGPTFWLLDGRTGWRTATDEGRQPTQGVSIGAVLRLSADVNGPLALTAADGSLGGLILPRGMALDAEGLLYLLGLQDPWIKRFEPMRQRFELLPTVGGEGKEARQFNAPTNIAIADHDLYVADTGNRRVQVFALGSLALRHVWGPWDANGRRPTAEAPDAWEPHDVTAYAGAAYILDGRYGRVYRHHPGTDRLQVVVDEPAAAQRWTRVAVDRDGRLYLFDATAPRLDIYDQQGQQRGSIQNAGEVRQRFNPPPIRLDHKARFCLPESLTRRCDRDAATATPAPETPLVLCPPGAKSGLIFNRQGEPVQVDASEPSGPKLYGTDGLWTSAALDSQIYRCQWHRIELELAELPPGTQVEVRTYTDQVQLPIEDILKLPDHLWDTRYRATGQMQPAPGLSAPPMPPPEFLVQSREGQYLWLRLLLSGDGYATPTVHAIRVHYPRQSYLKDLPAVYSADDESRWFLERFLSIFQTEWDALEDKIADMARHLDPKAVPAGPPLTYLASWLALPLEETWDWEQKRHLLTAAPRLIPRRGTIDGLRQYVRIYLQYLTGLTPKEQGDYPQVVEGFRERAHAMLAIPDLANLGYGAPLWSQSMVSRLQLGVFAREGEIQLVSTGDPERDVFHEYAHRFRVFIPSVWVRTANDELMVRRALHAGKPAHTHYDLCLVEPRFRVGLQSTVGLDTLIGPYPMARLACPHEIDTPPSQMPRYRLGYDTVLGGEPANGPRLRLLPGTRVGRETILT
jgi:phage tail-like protein